MKIFSIRLSRWKRWNLPQTWPLLLGCLVLVTFQVVAAVKNSGTPESNDYHKHCQNFDNYHCHHHHHDHLLEENILNLMTGFSWACQGIINHHQGVHHCHHNRRHRHQHRLSSSSWSPSEGEYVESLDRLFFGHAKVIISVIIAVIINIICYHHHHHHDHLLKEKTLNLLTGFSLKLPRSPVLAVLQIILDERVHENYDDCVHQNEDQENYDNH